MPSLPGNFRPLAAQGRVLEATIGLADPRYSKIP